MWRRSASSASAFRLGGLSSARSPAASSRCNQGQYPLLRPHLVPKVVGLQARLISTGPVTQHVANAGYPENSMTQGLLDKCMEAALGRGVNATAEYHPWLPVDLFQTMLVDIHEYAGCSWFAAITFACIGIRIITLPISIGAIRGAREKAIIQPEFNELMNKQQAASASGDSQKSTDIQQKMQAFQQKHGKFFMLKGTGNLILFQMPLYITAFAAIRGISSHPDKFPGFAMEAPLWLDSLALADPYCILPLLTSAIMLTNTELFGSIDTETAAASPMNETENQAPSSSMAMGQSTMQKYQKHFMRAGAVMFIPFTMSFPSGVFVFMSTNMITSTLQNRILRHPALERALEIPPRPEETAGALARHNAAGPPALVPLAMALPRVPKNHLLGTPKSIASRSSRNHDEVEALSRQVRPLRDTSVVDAVLQKGRVTNKADSHTTKLDQVNPKFSVRRVERPSSSAAL
eukprot:TRINITY_DN14759_c0_g1_i1.p1 TRINITY_DN14759_c0_g1~~TRINITY_DN14759_c0_g1_i1.p1  ORF type:complete len:463 (-),score=46.08 TRINITY_DN14759_c0_g1_i1:63-1451(-)